MDTLNVNPIEPEGGTTTINVGKAGKNVVITDNLKANTLKDAGGNTIFTSNGSGVLSSVNSGFGSAQVLLSTQTANNSSGVEFTSGIDGTYKEYVFDFINIHTDELAGAMAFQVSTDGGSSYATTVTTTNFDAKHYEGDAVASLQYNTAYDLAQSTGSVWFANSTQNAADAGTSGELHIFNPASTTYVKNWYSVVNSLAYRGASAGYTRASDQWFNAGYFNTTSAVNAIKIYPGASTFDGTIKLYGIK